MKHLDDDLHRLAERIDLPTTAPAQDLARGRARRRTRNLSVVGGSVAATAVIATGLAFLSGTAGGGASGSRDIDPGFSGQGTASSSASSSVSPSHRVRAHHRIAKGKATAGAYVGVTMSEADAQRVRVALDTYRSILRADLDPAGARIQTARITNVQGSDDSLGTKLDWNGGGMLEIAVGHSLDGVQFFCDGDCEQRAAPGTSKVLVQTSPGAISVAAFQDDGDIVAVTASTSFGNNGTSTADLGVTVDQLVAAAADPRLDVPDPLPQGQLPMSFFR
jgi:hypothetical protein